MKIINSVVSSRSVIVWAAGLLMLLTTILSGCIGAQAEMSRYYRDCAGRVSYILCPSPPNSYVPLEVNSSGALTKLRDRESQAVLLIVGGESNSEKIKKLKAMGFNESDDIRLLEYILCSQYATCGIARQQFQDARHNIIPMLEKD